MQQPALQRDDQSTVELVLVQELVQEPELPAPPSVMELELQLELELQQAQLHVQLQLYVLLLMDLEELAG